MKHRRLGFGIGVALAAAIALVAVARFAPAQVQAARQAVLQVVTTVTDSVSPAPSPTPDQTVQVGAGQLPLPSVVPTFVPTPPAEPTSFPHLAPSAAPGVPLASPPPGVQGEAPAPQTEVFVTASPCTGTNFDVNTGGCKGPAPFTVTLTASLQLGVAGVTPSFHWSDGQTGQTIQVTYSTPGTYTAPSVTVTQVVNGVTYQVHSTIDIKVVVG